MLKIGLAVGGGTGPELAKVFKTTLAALAGEKTQIVPWPRRARTYADVAWDKVSAAQAAQAAEEDARAYVRYLHELSSAGCPALFRTAFNAQSIYAVRERMEAVKIETLPLKGGRLLLIRDQAQGFYAGENDAPTGSPDEITRLCRFRRSTTERLLDFSLAEAQRLWGAAPDRSILVYKFHLLDNRFARWVFDYAKAKSVRLELYQPDTMNRELLRGALRGRVLIVGANEWADAMHADLLSRYGASSQEESFTRNVYLDKSLRGLVEYQTVHGSADDIAERDLVNPLATMRAAAAILETHAGRAGTCAHLESAVAKLKRRGSATCDAGGKDGTQALMNQVLELCTKAGARLR